MTKLIKNTFLVTVLAFLFAIPLMGFWFIAQNPATESEVLGYSTTKTQVIKTPAPKQTQVVDSIEITLNLSDNNPQQYFYDILPKKYLSSEYNTVVFLPNEFVQKGYKVTLDKSPSGGVLQINKPSGMPSENVPVYIIVLQ